ncbi:MAG TPA: isoleucine--tRNA ligase [Oscillospiraceae bacterium]|nr:isoleucine--tRNA ligase [Oscillospiraceae bacterium]HPS35043.1 isoleucine--tRNA ligase [Oscillospiraceae bacterium]
MPTDYNATLNLTKTDFPMRAGLPLREPEMLKSWQESGIYEQLLAKNGGKPQFILHDGPPFSNGPIHIGTAMNKLLKDFIIKYKAMQGYYTPYVPGWDNHGMPIESAIIKQNKLDRKKMSVAEFRSACHKFAADFVEVQKEGFERIGVWGDWKHPYLTMAPEFEAEEVKVFGEMYQKGYIYKGLKPVYWCPSDETALAEAEIEYADDPCETIYVKFPLVDDKGKLKALGAAEKTFFMIWTTTAWTLPANVAVCVGPEFEYALVKCGDECYVIAKELVESVMKAAKIPDYAISGTIKGSELEYMRTSHPFLDREALVIVGDYVTLDTGTGIVHIAPGHGMDDYIVCRKYKELPILVPVDDRGSMTAEAGKSAGLSTEKASPEIIGELRENGLLFASEKIVHQYPHCWRCHEPVLFRATSQWFCSVDAFKEQAVDAIKDVKFYPDWGHDRMVSMIRERSDWCISRQRNWGLPIPVFYCRTCGKPVCDAATTDAVSKLFGKYGSNAWFEKDAKDILPAGYKCPHCGATEFDKEKDTLDGWFDSGSTHFASLAKNNPEQWPADIYLEGGDQYRGWFQSSLLTAVATRGAAPYRTIITNGWTVDGEGRAMHKSLGNAVAPQEVIKDWGADVLRLWVAAADYQNDVRISPDIIKQLSEAYRKIRNTARFVLGNLSDFDPDKDFCDDYEPLDRWALSRLSDLVKKVTAAYDNYQFHIVYRSLYDFCVVDMSNIYFDVLKDRLYVEKADGKKRRAAQTVIWQVLDAITRIMAPIIAFTSDEIWKAMPHRKSDDKLSPVFNAFPKTENIDISDVDWDALFALREEVKKALEDARSEKLIGAPLDAAVTITTPDADKLAKDADLMRELCIVSGLKLEKGDKVSVKVEKAGGCKCVRCWTYSDSVGKDGGHPELCARCASILRS